MKRVLFVTLLSLLLFPGCNDTPPPVVDTPEVPVVVVPEEKETYVISSDPLYEDYLRATCRLVGGGSGGSGVAYKIDEQYVYILTCRHVVGKIKDFKVEFWLKGRITGEYDAKTLKILKADVAVLTIPVGDFKPGELPKTFPIASASPSPGEKIISVGCPGLSWQTLFEGHVMDTDTTESRNGGQESFTFVPPPKGGRSGSAIFQDGKIVGILWGSDRKTKGYAVRCEDMQSLIETGNIFFTASWCEYCAKMKPIIQTLRDAGVTIQVIDYDLNTAFAEMYGINSLPAYVNSRGETISGVQTAMELEEFFSRQSEEGSVGDRN